MLSHDDVLRSLVCLFAIDGEISPPEMTFLRDTATRLGVASEVVQASLDLARQGKGKVYLSENPDEIRQMIDLLVQASVADGRLDPQERKILNLIAAKIKMSGLDLETLLRQKLQAARAAQPPAALPGQSAGMTCPKCGFAQKTGRAECIRCGIIFQRVNRRSFEATQPLRKHSLDNVAVKTSGADLPQIWIDGDVLYVKTAQFERIMTLGSYCRQVEVDRRAREIRESTRWLWGLRRSRQIPFDRINSIETKYHSHHTRGRYGRTHESNIRYTIVLFLDQPAEWFTFFHFTCSVESRAKAAFEECFDLLKAFTT